MRYYGVVAATFVDSHPHRTAWRSAPRMRAWADRLVDAVKAATIRRWRGSRVTISCPVRAGGDQRARRDSTPNLLIRSPPDEALKCARPLPPRDRLVVEATTGEEWKAFERRWLRHDEVVCSRSRLTRSVFATGHA
jgi:hypothetical protein